MSLGSRYEIRGPLGKGGVSEVVEAWDRDLGRAVALKLLLEGSADAEVKRFEREGRLTARLAHPNIVPVYEVGRTEAGQPFIAMKRVQGRSLGELVEAGALTMRERLLVFLKVCDGVAFAHASGVLHRDLKPDNVMVGAHGEVLVMDWGLALDASDEGPDGKGPPSRLTRVGQVLGTPYYMAPEQARGEGRSATTAADVFALGAVLYTLLSGRPPYASKDLYEVVTQVAAGRVVPLSSVAPDSSSALRRVVERAMSLEPDARFPSVDALAEAVRDHLTPVAKPRSRVPLSVAIAGGLVVVLAGIAAGALVVVVVAAISAR